MKTESGSIRNAAAHVIRFLKKSYRDNIPAMAGQSAFFMILSVVPFLMFGFSVYSILTGKHQIEPYDQIPKINSETETYVRYFVLFIENSMERASSGRAVITAVVALWSAGKGMYCITEGVSRIYHIPNKHSWLFKRLFAMGYTLVLLIMLLISIAAAAISIFFTGTVISTLGLHNRFHYFLYILMYIAVAVIQALLMTVSLKLYLIKKSTDKRFIKVRALLPGMLFTVFAWYLLSFGVMIYLRHFAVSSIYGSLTSVIVVMLWVYFLMYILLYGIELDYIYRVNFLTFRPLLRLKERKVKKKNESCENTDEQTETTEQT